MTITIEAKTRNTQALKHACNHILTSIRKGIDGGNYSFNGKAVCSWHVQYPATEYRLLKQWPDNPPLLDTHNTTKGIQPCEKD